MRVAERASIQKMTAARRWLRTTSPHNSRPRAATRPSTCRRQGTRRHLGARASQNARHHPRRVKPRRIFNDALALLANQGEVFLSGGLSSSTPPCHGAAQALVDQPEPRACRAARREHVRATLGATLGARQRRSRAVASCRRGSGIHAARAAASRRGTALRTEDYPMPSVCLRAQACCSSCSPAHSTVRWSARAALALPRIRRSSLGAPARRCPFLRGIRQRINSSGACCSRLWALRPRQRSPPPCVPSAVAAAACSCCPHALMSQAATPRRLKALVERGAISDC